ncbi:hypothetical protein BGZ58_011162 [Dissophora ornata]|nr:hypothetical protein BGZ58_011162 [Dissophora ornata]
MGDRFPPGQFFICLRDTDLVIDVYGGGAEPGTAIILWSAKNDDNENQKWCYENGQLKNVRSGLALNAPQLAPNVAIDQQQLSGSANQRFEYYDYTISASEDEDLVLGILGSSDEGARVALIPRDNDSESQQWSLRRA